MSQRSTMRPPKGGNIKKGICQNHQYLNPDTGETGDCPKCASGEIQSVNVQRLSDFHCSVCGAKLTPVKDSFAQKNKKLLIVGAIVVALLGGGGIIYHLRDKTDITTIGGETKPQEGYTEDTDPISGGETKPQEEPTKAPDSVTPPTPAPQTVLGGAAKLVKESGYTHIVFLRDYTIDLGKNDGSTMQIRKGEIIERADIRHNVLRGGNYIKSDKEEQALSGLNVNL